MFENGQLINGDCLEEMKNIPDGSIDMILCDLPYGTTACAWDSVIPFEPLWEQYKRVIKKNGAIVLTAVQPFASRLVLSNEDMYKCEWVWRKSRSSNPNLAKWQPLRHHESVLVFGTGRVNYNPQMVLGEPYKTRAGAGGSFGGAKVRKNNSEPEERKTRYPQSVIDFASPYPNTIIHPTQKPVVLMEYLIKTYTNPGDTVLDNCSGSGTTAIACENTDRKWVCIERDEKYFEVSRERIERHVAAKDRPAT